MTTPVLNDSAAESDPLPAHAEASVLEPPRWHPIKRLLFRFALIYFVLYFLPFPAGELAQLRHLPPPLSWVGRLGTWISGTWEMGAPKYGLWDLMAQRMSLWVGEHILGLPESGPGAIVIQPTGSGDTMLQVVTTFCWLAIAAVAALVWSGIDRKRPHYPRLYAMFHVYVRYALAAILIGYGFAKFPPQQFPMPGPEKLAQSYGQSSMMGLLWTFMGASPAYTMFAGLSEALAGTLLIFRRTALLGALAAAAVMLNVFMLNMCYDVPVKFYSLNLLLASIVLALPYVPRLLRLVVLNKPVAPLVLWRPYARRWLNWSLIGLKVVALVLILGMGCLGSVAAWASYLSPPDDPPLTGLYRVESLELNGKPARELSDDERWRRVAFTRWGGAVIDTYADTRDYLQCQHTPARETLTLTPYSEGQTPYTLKCIQTEGTLTLEGSFQDAELKVVLKKVSDSDLPLRSRGFRWVQEMPVNW